jgi:serine/threonine-protein kinase
VLHSAPEALVADESALPKGGDIVAGKYRIERLLGMGGMGAVFEATHRVTGKRFAVKWLLPNIGAREEAAKRFIREAQVAGRFEHPNVVEVYDVGQERSSFYMVMELLEGESLAERLTHAKKLTYEECFRILLPCMRGVARAHTAGIVHRDLKPANIFLCRATADHPEHPKVLDFGISKMSNLAGEVDSSITKTGVVMGTPHYMSPEQVRGKAIDQCADIYAFGVILYQLLSGELPFPADTYSELVLQIATETPKPLDQLVRELPAGLVQLVGRAMARNPADRFQDLDSLVQALEPFTGSKPTSVAPASLGSSPLDSPSTGRSTVPFGDTPLSIESKPSLPAGVRDANRLLWMVGAVLAGVLVLATILVKLMPSGGPQGAAAVRAHAPNAATSLPESTPPKAAVAAPLARQAADAATAAQPEPGDPSALSGEPHPNTILLGREPTAEPPTRQPPAGLQNIGLHAGAQELPTGRMPAAGDTARDKRLSGHLGGDEKSRRRKARAADGQNRATTGTGGAGGATVGPTKGRLGIKMTEQQFDDPGQAPAREPSPKSKP